MKTPPSVSVYHPIANYMSKVTSLNHWNVVHYWSSATSYLFWRKNLSRMIDSWWRHQMGTFSALLAICAGNSPVPGEFPAQRPVTRSFDVFFDLRLNNRLSKQSWGWWFETLSRPLWCHCNVYICIPTWYGNYRTKRKFTLFTVVYCKNHVETSTPPMVKW